MMTNCDNPRMCEELIQIVNDNGLLQMQKEPTRESSILDLYLANKPGLVEHNTTIPWNFGSPHGGSGLGC